MIPKYRHNKAPKLPEGVYYGPGTLNKDPPGSYALSYILWSPQIIFSDFWFALDLLWRIRAQTVTIIWIFLSIHGIERAICAQNVSLFNPIMNRYVNLHINLKTNLSLRYVNIKNASSFFQIEWSCQDLEIWIKFVELH